MANASQRQIDANRKNAQKSTGPKTATGKERSRRNGLKHGLSAEVLVPEEDQARYEAQLIRWNREAGPDNVVEEHLIRRAAVGSVTLDRMDTSREETREETAREAVSSWEAKRQARARRKAQDLDKDPSNVVLDLEATSFGCDWLIRQWQSLDAPLRLGKGWDLRALNRAQRLLGLPEGIPGPDAEPTIRLLWILAAVLSPHTISVLPRNPDEASLPTDPNEARPLLRLTLQEQVDRLLLLRDESWEAVEGPERQAVISRALSADVSKEGQLRHRYQLAADRSCSAAVRLFLNLRDRRRRELLEIAKEARQCDTRAPPSVAAGGESQSATPPLPASCESSLLPRRPNPDRKIRENRTPPPDPPIRHPLPCRRILPRTRFPQPRIARIPTESSGTKPFCPGRRP